MKELLQSIQLTNGLKGRDGAKNADVRAIAHTL